MALFFPPRQFRVPVSELGPARGPLPLTLLGTVPPAGFIPGLPPGLTGVPEFEYWHDPRTGQLWSRPRPAPTRVRLAPPATVVGRTVQRSFVERERESFMRAPTPGARGFSPDFLNRLGNVAGNLLTNLLRVASFQIAGPVAPLIAPLVPVIRIGAPVVTQVAQPEPVAADVPVRELIAGRDPASFVFQLEASRGGVTEVVGGVAKGVVETVQGIKPFEVELPFPEVGLGQ